MDTIAARSLNNSHKISKIVCGAGHTVVLTSTGKLFSWGCNVLGQLGIGNNENQNVPTFIDRLANSIITKIASGAGHCVAIDTHGVAYSWGASADF